MRGFPESMLKTARDETFWLKAKTLLHVTPASDIDDTIFAGLQKAIDHVLEQKLREIPTAELVESAPLAVGRRSPTSTLRFNKFSVPGPMLGLYEKQRKLALKNEGEPLELMINCAVTNLEKGDDGVVRAIQTSKGVLSWIDEDTKIVLCAGVGVRRFVRFADIYTDAIGNTERNPPSELLRRMPEHGRQTPHWPFPEPHRRPLSRRQYQTLDTV